MELALSLYPTDLMSGALAQLYAHLMKFMITATKWYKRGKLAHALSAVSKPWALSFKDSVDDIAAASRYIDELSGTASRRSCGIRISSYWGRGLR